MYLRAQFLYRVRWGRRGSSAPAVGDQAGPTEKTWFARSWRPCPFSAGSEEPCGCSSATAPPLASTCWPSAVATPLVFRCARLTCRWIRPVKLFSQTSRWPSGQWVAPLFSRVFLHVPCVAVGEASCQSWTLRWGGPASPRYRTLTWKPSAAVGFWGYPPLVEEGVLCVQCDALSLCAHKRWWSPPPSSSTASCRLHDIPMALQELKNVAYFPKNPSSDSRCSHGNGIMTAFQRLSLCRAAGSLIPAQVVIVPFLFPESAFGTVYWRWTCEYVMTWKKNK